MTHPISNSNIIYTCQKSAIEGRDTLHKRSNPFVRFFREMTKPVGRALGSIITSLSKEDTKKLKELTLQKKQWISEGKASSMQIHIEGSKNPIDLDGIVFHPEKPSTKWVVIFNGMTDAFEWHLEGMKKLSSDLGANVITFNYRGVGESTGTATSASNFIEDGLSVLTMLKNEQNVKEEDIFLYGHSMGGGVAAEVHRIVKHKGPILSEFSFSSFSKAISLKANRVIGTVAKIFGWDFNAAKTFNRLPKEQSMLVVNRRDQVVRYEASLYKNLKKQKKEKLQTIKIGRNPKYEDLESIQVEKERKKVTQEKLTKKDFTSAIKDIKKLKLEKQLGNHHSRLMDNVIKKSDTAIPEKGQETLNKLKAKYNQENFQAYKEMVDIMNAIWKRGHR